MKIYIFRYIIQYLDEMPRYIWQYLRIQSWWNDKNPDGKFNTFPNLSISRLLLGYELWIRIGSKDCGISIRWMEPMCGYLCRGMYCFRASISFTRDAMENRSPTYSVILDAILMSRTVYAQNDTLFACMLVQKKRIDNGEMEGNMHKIMHEISRLEFIRYGGICKLCH